MGLGRIFGFRFPENCNLPYISTSIQEFWRRWHISLSTWFRDYLYIPLGGNQVKKWKTFRNLIIVFFLCGLWHGASWTFVVWGLLNGLVVSIESGLKPVLKSIHKMLGRTQIFFTTVVTVLIFMLMVVFFRSPNIQQAWYIFRSFFTLHPGRVFMGEPPTSFGYSIFAIVLLLAVEYVQEYHPRFKVLGNPNIVVRYTGYVLLLTILLLVGVFNGGQFIYFQF